ncbi:type II toxin-antitoxin system VapC family toxin [Skermania piniformis]|uniref:PIN domain-containing protein n=1 Tax=Skermania pinensis TaxID=39122 RepID=A0ABX8S9N4_9ACTN|nr:PIN domain-containing protein [Skermania piniformis]QXQ14575.1 PIN domain-containing protein [Skermania piniformis]
MALGTLVDSNVLLDVFTDDRRWGTWSADHVAAAFDAGSVAINPLIFAELSIGFDRVEDLDAALPDRLEREDLPWEGAYPAGRCFLQYRRSGGTRRSPLPDFYIAAHAAVSGRALLTRDRPRYLHLLPALEVVAPEQAAACCAPLLQPGVQRQLRPDAQ